MEPISPGQLGRLPRALAPAEIEVGVVVPAGQNYVVLSVAGSQTPAQTVAVGAVTTAGAVAAAHGGVFGSAHSLAEVAGPTPLRPKNICLVTDAATEQVVLSSSGKEVWALLQSESAVNGHTLNDVAQQAQLSFVISNPEGTDLIACPTADIENQTIFYSYIRRVMLGDAAEESFLPGTFTNENTITRVEVRTSAPIDPVDGRMWFIIDP